jgi:hypothetical protein
MSANILKLLRIARNGLGSRLHGMWVLRGVGVEDMFEKEGTPQESHRHFSVELCGAEVYVSLCSVTRVRYNAGTV